MQSVSKIPQPGPSVPSHIYIYIYKVFKLVRQTHTHLDNDGLGGVVLGLEGLFLPRGFAVADAGALLGGLANGLETVFGGVLEGRLAKIKHHLGILEEHTLEKPE